MDLPRGVESLLVRTHFGDDAAWAAVKDAATAENDDGFCADVRVVDDPAYDGVDWLPLRGAARIATQDAAVLFVADADAHSGHFPIVVVDLAEDRQPFRCAASQLWAVDNNLNLANMDWEDFADYLDSDGVYREG
jgi:hypothetical protein